ncbi:MAG: PA2169 family four-helix-bundle protein [Acidobacteriota bacterium]
MINDYEATIPMTTDAEVTHAETLSNDEVISVLNSLIQTCKDGQEGFQTAADGAERSDLKTLLYEYSQQRSQFAGELQTLVQSIGGDPEKSGSIAGALHRGWIDIKKAVVGNDEEAILNECERGEDSAKGAYKSAAEHDLPAYIHDVVTEQLRAVMQSHDRIKALRDAAKNAQASSASARR